MIGSLFFGFAVNLLSLVALAAGDEETYQCPDLYYDYDARYKGNLSSPLYGQVSEYAPNLLCWYRITAPEGHLIKLTFLDFDIQVSPLCDQDQLHIRAKDSNVLLGSFCGSQLPRPLLSIDNVITLVFTTDYIQGGRGFLIQYESGPYMQLCDYGYKACRNRNCYNPWKACDGVDDCGDGTDEEGCHGHLLVVNPSDCGTPAIHPKANSDPDRIIAGEEAIPNSWPWQVSLRISYIEPNGHSCGGTLINTMWVLTAAHCVEHHYNPGDLRIVLGAHGKFTRTQYEQVRYSAKVIVYPELLGDDIRRYSMTHDIALIRLNAPVQLNAGVHPACLPTPSQNILPGWHCYATGWGESRGTGSSSSLKQTLLFAWGRDRCGVFNESSQVCLGNTGTSTCSGDSGGPLSCKFGPKWFVYGALSTSSGGNRDSSALCGGQGAYVTYSLTTFKQDWILDVINRYTLAF